MDVHGLKKKQLEMTKMLLFNKEPLGIKIQIILLRKSTLLV